MNLFRTLRVGALFLGTGLGLGGCLNPPEYPIEPSIEFGEVVKTHYPAAPGGIAIDSLEFKINFRDGDGDLGLSDVDLKSAPYTATTGGHNNRGYRYNYYIQTLTRNSAGRFVPLVFGFVGEFDGTYPRLDGAGTKVAPRTDGTGPKSAPIKGELRYKLPLLIENTKIRAGQVLRFEISILDRGLHQSNVITTPDVVVGP